MKTNRQRATKRGAGPVLAAAVGLGDITLDTVTIRPGQTLRVGDGRDCDLPFTCAATEIARRDEGTWLVDVPDGASIPGASAVERMVRLQDWNPGVTITDGAAWLRVWPTRGERFAGGPGAMKSTARDLGRALPVMWLALSLTLAVGTFGVWASGVLGGGSGALSLGEGGGRGVDIPDRFATFGDGELGQPGDPLEEWISIPVPELEDDAVVDEIETETEIETEIETDLTDDALAIETDVAEPPEQPQPEPEDTASAKRRNLKGPRGNGATAEGGASGFGFGGGTDDGYGDRSDSMDALERMLASCMEGRHTHKLTLAVNSDGRLKPGSLSYAMGWTAGEQTCVARAIDEWAFPTDDETYDVSLRVRKSRGGRA